MERKNPAQLYKQRTTLNENYEISEIRNPSSYSEAFFPRTFMQCEMGCNVVFNLVYENPQKLGTMPGQHRRKDWILRGA